MQSKHLIYFVIQKMINFVFIRLSYIEISEFGNAKQAILVDFDLFDRLISRIPKTASSSNKTNPQNFFK
ncbi:hypothetical protein T07_11900 [Trichinella nelsoni]|uniref:Uncharacterized protein n=1 Tax=Trichinella nelsoni TaxID=6336 RepID=A0A0V0RL54_9BILA|nr:hypothetical protein T07_11900 [Trichinella nelsoni]